MNSYSFKKYQPAGLRLWHWLNALAILGLLGTAFLRKTFLSWRGNAALIEQKIQAAGGSITPELAKDIAVGIRTPMWDWHYVLGFTLGGLLVVRILVGIFSVKSCPAAHAVKATWNLSKVPAAEKANAVHYALVRTGYALFYLITAFMVVSGLVMYFKDSLGLDKAVINPIKEVHELSMWFFVVFVVGHLVGVIIAELRHDQGLVSDMIHGGKKE